MENDATTNTEHVQPSKRYDSDLIESFELQEKPDTKLLIAFTKENIGKGENLFRTFYNSL